MLNFILGRAGTGKTQTVRQMLVDRAALGRKELYLIVPEQYSFETEREILRMAGPQNAAHVQVYSFTRLAEAVFRRCGGCAGTPLDDATRRLLMALAFEETADQLELYREHRASDRLCEMMLAADAELQMCGVTPQAMRHVLPEEDDSALARKLREIGLVCSAYRALVQRSFTDAHAALTRLAELLREQTLFAGATIAVDSFISFTRQEIDVLAALMPQCENMFVTLCCDDLRDDTEGRGLFSLVQKTGRRLLRCADEQNVQVGPTLHLDVPCRFANDALRHMERELFRDKPSAFTGDAGDAVTLLHPSSRFEEAEMTAALIRELVLRQGYRYRDVSVICRDSESYAVLLQAAFAKRDIPCFIDAPRCVDTEPLVRLVLSSLRALSLRSEDVLTVLKTGLLGVDELAVAALENYIFTWNITGAAWRQPFDRHPDGFGARWRDEDREAIAAINETRRRVVEPLLQLAEDVRCEEGGALCRAIYRLLRGYGVDKTLPALCAALEADGQYPLAQEQLRMWEVLMQLLERFYTVLQGRKINVRRFGELLSAAVGAQTVSVIPQGMDEVVFGTADRIRPSAPRAVFLLGTGLGEFPRALGESGLLTLEERRRLQELGLELQDPEASGTVGELYLAYAAACAPAERLFVSWPAEQEDVPPGELPTALMGLFGLRPVRQLPETALLNGEKAAFSRLCARWREDGGETAALRTYFAQEQAFAGRLAAVERAASGRPAVLREPETARRLLTQMPYLSASQVESFFQCRFGYFCRYGLGVRERRPAEMSPTAYGTLMHYLLEQILREGAAAFLERTPEERAARLEELVAAYMEENLGGAGQMSRRELYRFKRLAQTARTVLLYAAEGLRDSKFQPAYFELQLDARAPDGAPAEAAPCAPLTLQTAAGPLHVGGIVDRVDLYTRGGETFVRVVDYKTGPKEFKLSDVRNGINLQMLIYLAAIVESTGWTPAGILYMPAAVGAVPEEKGTSAQKIDKDLANRLRMNGLLPGDAELLLAMDPAGEGRYLPAEVKDGQPAAGDSLVTAQDMNAVLRYVKGKVAEMAEALLGGQIAARPLLVNHNPCAWCPYGGTCLQEHTDADVAQDETKNAQAVEAIRETLLKEDGRGTGLDA